MRLCLLTLLGGEEDRGNESWRGSKSPANAIVTGIARQYVFIHPSFLSLANQAFSFPVKLQLPPESQAA